MSYLMHRAKSMPTLNEAPPASPTRRPFKVLPFLAALVFAIWTTGCSTQSAGRLAGKTVSAMGSVATKTTVAVVKTSGQVAYGTGKVVVQTTGSVATTVIKTGFVTVKDTATGVSKQIPWTEGMKLYASTKTAQFDAGVRALQVLRGAQVIQSDLASLKSGKGDIALQPGDMVKLVRK